MRQWHGSTELAEVSSATAGAIFGCTSQIYPGSYNGLGIGFDRTWRTISGMKRRATNLGMLVLILAALLMPSISRADVSSSSQPTTTPTRAVVIPLRGRIDDYNRDALFERFDKARQVGARTIIVEIDTYGGLVTAALDISRFIKRQTDLRTIAFVHDKAISAGAMIALACDEIVMEPGSVLGDCAPIALTSDGSMQSLGAAERAKLESPILADFRESALRNGYDPLLAEAMVDVSRSVHWIEYIDGPPPPVREFVDDAEFKQRMKVNDIGWTVVPDLPDPIDSDKTLLTVHADAAMSLGLAKAIAASPEALASSRGLNILATIDPGAGERFVQLLGSWPARFLLVIVFLMSLYLALHIPGHGPPEAVAIISLAVLLGVPLLSGYAQWWEILAIVVGLGLLAFEIFVFPGHYVAGAVGAILMFVGLVMTFVPRDPLGTPGYIPALGATWPSLERGLMIVTSAMACSLLLCVWLNRYLPKLPYFNRLVLNAVTGDGGAAQTQWWPPVGTIGRATSDLRPAGSAEFEVEPTGAHPFDVVSDSGFVHSGTKVIVQRVDDRRVVVRAVT